jgi:glycine betaine/proline transport system ATP-binding protein
MNPLGVLTARDVMQDTPSDGPQIPAEMPVRDILARFADTPVPLAVTEGETVIGTVTTDSIAARLGTPG